MRATAFTTTEQLEHLRRALQKSGLEDVKAVLPQDHEVTLRGMRFHYLDWGDSGKQPVLFLHGGGLTAHTWDVVCLALRDSYRCVALDQRGHGDSDWSETGDYSVQAYREDLESFVGHLGLHNPVLVGQSLGGRNAISYTGRHSADVKALVAVDIGPDFRREGAHKIRDFMAMPAELDSVERFVERAMAFNPMRDERLLRRSLMHNLKQLPNGKWTWKYDRRFPRGAEEDVARSTEALWQDARQINCPTLVARGAHSEVFTDTDAERFATSLPKARWVRVENAGHTIQGDNPKGFLEATQAFFTSHGI